MTRPWLHGVDLATLTRDELEAAVRSALIEIAAREQTIETLTAEVVRLRAEVDELEQDAEQCSCRGYLRDYPRPEPEPPMFGPELPYPPCEQHEYPDLPRNGRARCGKCHRVYIVAPPDPEPEFLP